MWPIRIWFDEGCCGCICIIGCLILTGALIVHVARAIF